MALNQANKNLRVGIIGCGYIAGEADDSGERLDIYTHAKAIKHHPQMHLAACCDTDDSKLQKFGDRWEVAARYKSYSEMLTSECLDIVVISTPTSTHYDIVFRVLEFPIAAVFCEKPLAETRNQARMLVEKARQMNVALFVNFMRRWDSFYLECKNLLSNEGLGRIETIVAYVDTALYMNAIHMIDILLFFGGCVEKLSGVLDRRNKIRTVHGKEDYGGVATLRHRNGVYSFIKATGASRRNHYFELDIQCTEGRLRMLGDGDEYEIYRFDEIKEKPWLSELRLQKRVRNSRASQRMTSAYTNIFDTIGNCAPIRSSGEQSLEILEIIEKWYVSDQNGGGWVTIDAGDADV